VVHTGGVPSGFSTQVSPQSGHIRGAPQGGPFSGFRSGVSTKAGRLSCLLTAIPSGWSTEAPYTDRSIQWAHPHWSTQWGPLRQIQSGFPSRGPLMGVSSRDSPESGSPKTCPSRGYLMGSPQWDPLKRVHSRGSHHAGHFTGPPCRVPVDGFPSRGSPHWSPVYVDPSVLSTQARYTGRCRQWGSPRLVTTVGSIQEGPLRHVQPGVQSRWSPQGVPSMGCPEGGHLKGTPTVGSEKVGPLRGAVNGFSSRVQPKGFPSVLSADGVPSGC
jgi:hypothetical protein